MCVGIKMINGAFGKLAYNGYASFCSRIDYAFFYESKQLPFSLHNNNVYAKIVLLKPAENP